MNRDRIISALTGKPLTTVFLWREEEECGCAIGTLLVEAGVAKEDLDGSSYPDGGQLDLLKQEYGLEEDDVDVIINTNDSIYTEDYVQRSARLILSLKEDDA